MEELVRIAGILNAFEADILRDMLAERDIPHIIRSFFDSAYDGIFQGQKGWGAVYAPESSRAEVTGMLAAIRKAAAGEDDS